MKLTRFILILASSITLLGGAARADDTTTPSTPRARKHMGPPPTPEMKAYHELVLKIYDADKNGMLDETERTVLHEDIEAGRMQPPPRGPHGRGHRGPPPEILARYDSDKDGVLNETERAALEADIAAGKIPPPPRPDCAPDGPPPATGKNAQS